MKNNTNKYEEILSIIPSFIINLDFNNIVQYCNKSFKNLLDIKKNSLNGLELQKINIDWNKEKLLETLSLCRKNRKKMILDNFNLKSKNEKLFILQLIIIPLEKKQNTGDILIIGRDITHQKLLESQLVQAQKLEAVGHLASGIAHEINSPLQAVLMNVDYLNTKIDKLKNSTHEPKDNILNFFNNDISEALNTSILALNKIDSIIKSLRNFTAKSKHLYVKSNLNEAIQSTISISTYAWKSCALITTNFSKDIPLIKCSIDELNQVFLNMIINACHSIKEKNNNDGNIHFKTSFDDCNINVEISDNGGGISPEIINRIFDPFFTTKKVGKGTGQGLAISYDIIVNKHKGKIKVDSKINQGTTFFISLPIK